MFNLPKSIPSDTFPLATDNKTAPRPFSQAFKWICINLSISNMIKSSYISTIYENIRSGQYKCFQLSVNTSNVYVKQ